MIVVGVSGAHGAGKTTLLNELRTRGWRIDDFKVARAVQKELGWDSLDRATESWETMMAFQEQVLLQKRNHDLMLAAKANTEFPPIPDLTPENDRVIIVERTFADICAYADLWAWKLVDAQKVTLTEAIMFLVDYAQRCGKAQNEIYGGTVLLPLMDHVVWEEDKHRAKKQDAQTMFEDVERFMQRKVHITHPRMRISAKTTADRADQVEAFLEQL